MPTCVTVGSVAPWEPRVHLEALGPAGPSECTPAPKFCELSPSKRRPQGQALEDLMGGLSERKRSVQKSVKKEHTIL